MIRSARCIIAVLTLVGAAMDVSADRVEAKSESRTSQKVCDASGSWSADRSAAIAAFERNEFVKAEKLAKKAFADTIHMKENDPRVLQSSEDLGQIYLRQRKFDEARPLFTRVLKLKERKYGKDSAELIQPLNDVVRVTCAGGACYDTIPYLKRLLSIRRRVEPKSRDIPITLLLIGEAYEKRQAYPEAM
jgi:tetratricopeptide (TPR) repeat protein